MTKEELKERLGEASEEELAMLREALQVASDPDVSETLVALQERVSELEKLAKGKPAPKGKKGSGFFERLFSAE